MKIISHRGYLNGANNNLENHPEHIDKCIELGFDVEIDLRLISETLYLGHDFENHKITIEWLLLRKKSLWIHCKNFDSLNFLTQKNFDLNFFWHEDDLFTLTSKKIIWAYPCKNIFYNAVNVLPELNFNKSELMLNKDIYAICTDFPIKFSI